jgi:formate/nitrite transporter FocA (FNT family)
VLSLASFIGAGVFVGTGIVLVATAREDKPKAPPGRAARGMLGGASMRCALAGAAVVCGGQF